MEVAFKANDGSMIELLSCSDHESLEYVDWQPLLERWLSEATVQTLPLAQRYSSSHIDLDALAKIAIKNEEDGALSYLLANGLKVNDSEGFTSLSELALKEGKVRALELLLENGADPNTLNFHNKSLLWLATEEGSDEEVAVLLRYGAQIRTQTDRHSFSVLKQLSDRVNRPIKELFRTGVMDPYERDEYGINMLNSAVMWGDLPLIRILVEDVGMDVSEDYFGRHGQGLIVFGDHPEVFQYLVDHGADRHSEFQGEPLLFAVPEPLVPVLIDAGANVNCETRGVHISTKPWSVRVNILVKLSGQELI